MTALYILDRADAPIPETAAGMLPSWRRQKLEPLRNENARQECLCAGLLFLFAAKRRGLSPDEPVTLLPAGKPVFAGRDDHFFSLSHSGRFVLCAFAASPVGADIQQIRPFSPGILRRFSSGEQAFFQALPQEERQAAFFRLWTRKEAWVKAVSGSRMVSLSGSDVTAPLPGLHFFDLAPAEDYAAALCGADSAPPSVLTLTSDELLRSPELAG